ncbi:unnamed protein product [Protopolystoma xenopodis]|uniref:Uncharacterized protein n=1 Tax=Protopolystoma xenopodis TaxID=117903 RepID=A0A3S4ZUS2_9PLAT|nr:unnamed protein product [Protopolystoma xenopodis]
MFDMPMVIITSTERTQFRQIANRLHSTRKAIPLNNYTEPATQNQLVRMVRDSLGRLASGKSMIDYSAAILQAYDNLMPKNATPADSESISAVFRAIIDDLRYSCAQLGFTQNLRIKRHIQRSPLVRIVSRMERPNLEQKVSGLACHQPVFLVHTNGPCQMARGAEMNKSGPGLDLLHRLLRVYLHLPDKPSGKTGKSRTEAGSMSVGSTKSVREEANMTAAEAAAIAAEAALAAMAEATADANALSVEWTNSVKGLGLRLVDMQVGISETSNMLMNLGLTSMGPRERSLHEACAQWETSGGENEPIVRLAFPKGVLIQAEVDDSFDLATTSQPGVERYRCSV